MPSEELSLGNRMDNGSHSANPKGVETNQHDFVKQKPSSEKLTLSKMEEEILTVLAGKELYGLQIIQAFQDASHGQRSIGVGSLYPTLSRLEEKGLISSWMEDRPNDDRGGARRKYFKITQHGVMALATTEQFRQKLFEWRPA